MYVQFTLDGNFTLYSDFTQIIPRSHFSPNSLADPHRSLVLQQCDTPAVAAGRSLKLAAAVRGLWGCRGCVLRGSGSRRRPGWRWR